MIPPLVVTFILASFTGRSHNAVPAAYAAAPAMECRLDRSSDARWLGTCGRWLGEIPTFAFQSAAAVTTGRWRPGPRPVEVWSGKMFTHGDGPVPNDPEPVELEVYHDRTGILRTLEGWYPLRAFKHEGEGTLVFSVDTSTEVRPSSYDRQIIKRAAAILSSESTWNRQDDRQCPAQATTWSIFCAMQRATIEVSGGFHHRRPALEIVRQLVERRTAGRQYQHRLKDYNNDPSTRLADVQSLFAEALHRMPLPRRVPRAR